MKYTTIFAAFVAAASAAATPGKRWGDGCLTSSEANTIVAKFASVLEAVDYNGQIPNVTAVQVVAPNYMEYSDSILSLEHAPLGDTPSATSRAQWLGEVLAHPDAGIITLDVLHSCNKIMWHWLFPDVASGQYRVKGFNLFTVNSNHKIERADIEFNSIAWGLDDGQLYQWCPPANSSSS